MSQDIEELVEPRHHRAEIVFGAAAFLTGIFLATQLGSQVTWKQGLPFVKQPGFFATMSIVGMLFFGAFELYFTWQRNRSNAEGDFTGQSVVGEVGYWIRTIEFAIWFMVYVWVVPHLGYIGTTLIFCLLLTVRVGYRSGRMLASSLLVGFATVVIFKGLLSVKIPGGAVYEYLPTALRNILILYF